MKRDRKLKERKQIKYRAYDLYTSSRKSYVRNKREVF
jgi:hypothetical protein